VDHFSDVVDGRDAADDGGEESHEHGVLVGGAEFGVHGGEKFSWQQPVIGHGIKHAGLPQQHDQHDAGKAGERADGDDVRGDIQAAVQEGFGNGRFDIDVLPANHAGEHAGYKDVQNGANQQRGHDA